MLADTISAVLWESDKGDALQRCHQLGQDHFGLANDEVDRFLCELSKTR